MFKCFGGVLAYKEQSCNSANSALPNSARHLLASSSPTSSCQRPRLAVCQHLTFFLSPSRRSLSLFLTLRTSPPCQKHFQQRPETLDTKYNVLQILRFATVATLAAMANAQLQVLSPGGPNLWWGALSRDNLAAMDALSLQLGADFSHSLQLLSPRTPSPGTASNLRSKTSPESCM